MLSPWKTIIRHSYPSKRSSDPTDLIGVRKSSEDEEIHN